MWLPVAESETALGALLVSRACPELSWARVGAAAAALESGLSVVEALAAGDGNQSSEPPCAPGALEGGMRGPGAAPQPPGPPRAVAIVLRDPHIRVASAFLDGLRSCTWLQKVYLVSPDEGPGWTHARLEKLWAKGVLQSAFGEFLTCTAGCQSNVLLGLPCAEVPQQDQPPGFGTANWGERSAAELRTAVFVGLYERWADSVALFASLYGGPPPAQLAAVAAQPPPRFPEFEARLVKLARRRGDAADDVLHRAAVAWFDHARTCAGLAPVEGGDDAQLAACAAANITPAGPLPHAALPAPPPPAAGLPSADGGPEEGCPAWLDAYVAWHEKALTRRGGVGASRELVVVPFNGIGDRWRGIKWALELAIEHQLLLTIKWGVEVSAFVEPAGTLDWRPVPDGPVVAVSTHSPAAKHALTDALLNKGPTTIVVRI